MSEATSGFFVQVPHVATLMRATGSVFDLAFSINIP
jgi:hypothetical protein